VSGSGSDFQNRPNPALDPDLYTDPDWGLDINQFFGSFTRKIFFAVAFQSYGSS
jgi:hypothetical protein